jgi:hypothetical protein
MRRERSGPSLVAALHKPAEVRRGVTTTPHAGKRRLSAAERAAVIEALASALVEDYLFEQQQLADAADASRRGVAR